MMFSSVASADSISAESKSILSDFASFSIGEEAAQIALAKLNTKSRPKLVSAVREGLASGGEERQIALKLARAVGIREIVPQLKQFVQKSEDFEAFLTLNSLLETPIEKKEIAAVYLQRLDSPLPSATRMAVLDGLSSFQSALSNSTFDKLIEDSSFEVRESTVRHFLATRHLLSRNEQVRRFRLVLKVKPYQVRLEAMERFLALSKSEKKNLASAFSGELCESEPILEVKAVCEKIEVEMRKQGAVK